MKVFAFFLFFSLFTFRATGMEPDKKIPLLSKLGPIVQTAEPSPFQSLPDPISHQVLGYLVAGDKEGAKGFLSLAVTCKANKELCENFCIQSSEAQELKLKYLKLRAYP